MRNILRVFAYAKPYWHLLVIAGLSLLAITGLNLLAPWFIRNLVKILTENFSPASFPQIRNLSLLLAGVFIAKAFFRYLNNYLAHVAAWNLVSDMRVLTYDHLQKLSLRYYHDKQTGQLMSRTTNDTATFESLIAHSLPDLITNILILISVTVILFWMNPRLALLTTIPIPFLIVGAWLFTKKVLPNFKAAQSTLGELNAVLQDNLSGMKEIQAFNQQHREKKQIQKRSRSYAEAILRALRLSSIFHPGIEAISSMGTVIVVGFGGWLALQGNLSVADIVGFLLYLTLFYQPISTLARVTEDLQQSIAGAERVFEVLDTDPDVKDSPQAKQLGPVKGEILFRDVHFHYREEKPVLKGISFDVKPGEMVALVGPTGVGKTTVISLITRFYDTTAGKISVDGHDVKDVTLASLRNQISIVLQDVFLFNGTAAENIAYGAKEASLDEIVAAARIAHAHEFITELPEGYDTMIGERGTKLSGGQKQRIAIARAVLRKTPILILDEATASVDVETEKRIQQAIQELVGSRTIIVIAHRLSTVKSADKILLIEDGRITESGKHEELFNRNGTYRHLCDIQFR